MNANEPLSSMTMKTGFVSVIKYLFFLAVAELLYWKLIVIDSVSCNCNNNLQLKIFIVTLLDIEIMM